MQYNIAIKGLIIMTTTNVTVRMDKNLKSDFEKMLAAFGMNTSVAINIFARQVVYERRIPFAIARDRPNAETQAAMEDARAHRGLSKSFSSVKDLIADLDA